MDAQIGNHVVATEAVCARVNPLDVIHHTGYLICDSTAVENWC